MTHDRTQAEIEEMETATDCQRDDEQRCCEDCGDPTPGRRFRCRDCNKLVCSWCSGHTHRCRK
jgi:hypothetical protein